MMHSVRIYKLTLLVRFDLRQLKQNNLLNSVQWYQRNRRKSCNKRKSKVQVVISYFHLFKTQNDVILTRYKKRRIFLVDKEIRRRGRKIDQDHLANTLKWALLTQLRNFRKDLSEIGVINQSRIVNQDIQKISKSWWSDSKLICNK